MSLAGMAPVSKLIAVVDASYNRHAWLAYMVDKPPSEDPVIRTGVRSWEPGTHRPNLTWTRSAYKPYNT